MTNTAETHALVQREKGKKHMIQRRLIPAYIFLIIISFISVFPLLWMISAATNTSLDVARGKIMFGTYAMQNFKNLIASQNLAGAMGNSFLYAIVQTVISMFVCSLAGFGFELYHDKNKDRLFSILLLAMMVPQVATMVPLFKMMSRAGLLNSVWAFILPSISTPFLIMMFRQNSRNFPNDLMQAARIDGLSETGIFFRMYVPIMKSTYAAAAVITFMNAWNAYMWPKVVMTDNRAQTMPMLIATQKAVGVLQHKIKTFRLRQLNGVIMVLSGLAVIFIPMAMKAMHGNGSQMNHAGMNHGAMSSTTMSQPAMQPGMNHSQMDHSQMQHQMNGMASTAMPASGTMPNNMPHDMNQMDHVNMNHGTMNHTMPNNMQMPASATAQ